MIVPKEGAQQAARRAFVIAVLWFFDNGSWPGVKYVWTWKRQGDALGTVKAPNKEQQPIMIHHLLNQAGQQSWWNIQGTSLCLQIVPRWVDIPVPDTQTHNSTKRGEWNKVTTQVRGPSSNCGNINKAKGCKGCFWKKTYKNTTCIIFWSRTIQALLIVLLRCHLWFPLLWCFL